jgi:hypothetical protein
MDKHPAERHPPLAYVEIGAGKPVGDPGHTLVHLLEGEQALVRRGLGKRRHREGKGGKEGKEGKRLKHLKDLAGPSCPGN